MPNFLEIVLTFLRPHGACSCCILLTKLIEPAANRP